MKKSLIIDGNSLINRAFYALPLLTNSDGVYLNGVYGFMKMLIKAIKENNPDYILVTFDMKAPTFRHKLYKEYKGNRKKMPEELGEQIPLLKNILKAMDIKIIEKEGFEADDIIGYVSKNFDTQNYILTGDRDNFQLINDKNHVWFTKKGISDLEKIDYDKFKSEYGFQPEKLIDLKALMGDSSDNIPGVPGIGKKTAHKLIRQYGSLDNVYKNLDDFKGKMKEKITEYKDQAYLSYKLAKINTSFDIKINLDECKYIFPFDQKVYDKFKKYEFKTLLNDKEIFNNIDDE